MLIAKYTKVICLSLSFLMFCLGSAGSSARSNFIVNGDDTVTHATTRLMWQQEPQVSFRTYASAVSYCSSTGFAGYDDWRIPSLKELLSLVDYKRFDPALDPIVFDQISSGQSMWAHSQRLGNTTVWTMNAKEGRVVKHGAPSATVISAYPLCVREDY